MSLLPYQGLVLSLRLFLKYWSKTKLIRLPVCVAKALNLINGGGYTTMTDLPHWSCGNITKVGQLGPLVISAFEPWYNSMLFAIFVQALRDIVNFMFKQLFNHSFSVFMCRFIFFNVDLNWKNSTLHFSCPVSVWSDIFILFKVSFYEIVPYSQPVGQIAKLVTVFLP